MFHNIRKYCFIDKFDTDIINNQDKKTVIIFRNYKFNNQKEEIILKLKNYCKKKGIKFLISNDIKLAVKLDLNGVYIPSFNNEKKHLSYSFKRNFIVIGSAHNLKEIREKELQRVHKIVISSLFKKNDNYLGIYKFMNLKKVTNKNIIPLGGIKKDNLKKLKLIGCNCFAGISFYKKKAPKT